MSEDELKERSCMEEERLDEEWPKEVTEEELDEKWPEFGLGRLFKDFGSATA